MEPVAGLDASFLALETPTSHLHVTGVMVLDPGTVPGGYSFELVKRFIACRLDLAPAFRRRLATVPFNLGPPVWVDDASFDIDYHVRRAALPAPGGPDDLATFAADVAGRPLDRSRPLWEMWVVEGVEAGRVAVVAKMHHATIDGVSGANLMGHLFDLEPRPVEPPPTDNWRPQATPSELELTGRALADWARRPVRLASGAAGLAATLGRTVGRRVLGRGGRMATPFSAPATVLGGAITPHRRVVMSDVALDDVKVMKQRFDTTVNTVVLSICGGALRAYLEAHDALPEEPLVAAVPVSVRGDDSDGAAVQVSLMFVSLATDVADPVERLRRVDEAARSAKDEHDAVGGKALPQVTELASIRLLGLGARLYSQLGLARRLPSPANLLISNIPGPDISLYFAGAKLLGLYPLGPIYHGMALNITVLSYMDAVGFGLVTCRELVPDPQELSRAISESLHELMKA
jgi:WS/DGAT/MGAT family acyltransferase